MNYPGRKDIRLFTVHFFKQNHLVTASKTLQWNQKLISLLQYKSLILLKIKMEKSQYFQLLFSADNEIGQIPEQE